MSKHSFTDVISGALGFSLVAMFVVKCAPDHLGEAASQEEPVGETILEEIIVERPAPLVLPPADTSLLIDYMMGYEKSKGYKRPLKAPKNTTTCDEMWGIVHVFNGYRYTLRYCDEQFEGVYENSRFDGDQLIIYKVPANQPVNSDNFEDVVSVIGDIDGYVFADWHYRHYSITSYEECESMYCDPPAWANDLAIYEQQAEYIQITDELIAYYETGR